MMEKTEKKERKQVFRCVLCGADIYDVFGEDPNDSGLHWFDKRDRCCGYCKKYITSINRSLMSIVYRPNNTSITKSIRDIRKVLDRMEANKDDLIAYYQSDKDPMPIYDAATLTPLRKMPSLICKIETDAGCMIRRNGFSIDEKHYKRVFLKGGDELALYGPQKNYVWSVNGKVIKDPLGNPFCDAGIRTVFPYGIEEFYGKRVTIKLSKKDYPSADLEGIDISFDHDFHLADKLEWHWPSEYCLL